MAIIYVGWGTKCDGHVRSPHSEARGPFFHLGLPKWPQNLHKCASPHAKWFHHHAMPNWFEIFKNFMKKLKFGLPIVKHVPKTLLHSTKGLHGHMLHHNITTEHHLKLFDCRCSIQKLWSTVVWPNLQKFINNSKMLKKSWNLRQWHLCIN